MRIQQIPIIRNIGRYISISGLDLAVIRMNIVIKEAEEKHVIFCVNILQNTGLGTIYFSNYQKAADLLLHALAQRELFVALNDHGDCLGFMYFMPKGVFGSYPYHPP